MKTYIKFMTIRFFGNFESKFNKIIEILETLFFFVIYWYVFRALYQDVEVIDGITFEMAITSMLISIGSDYSYYKDKMYIQEKIKQGTLLVELIKPVNYQQRLFFEDMGDTAFFILFRYMPVVFISLLFADLIPPKNLLYFVLFVLSIFLGYIINWYLDFICNELAFFVFSVWGIVTIKNALTDIFGGVLLPVWFLPKVVRKVLLYTPILSIYYIPINLYFGMYSGIKILFAFASQVFWIAVLVVLSKVIWKKGLNTIFVKGV